MSRCPAPDLVLPTPDGSGGSRSLQDPVARQGGAGAELRPLFQMNGVTILDPLHEKKSLLSQGRPDLVDIFWGKANSWVETTGRHPSRGWLLVTGDSLRYMPQTPLQTLHIQDSRGRRFSRGGLIATRKTVVVAQQEATNQDPARASYLVELADSRYYAQWSVATTEYNVRDAYCISYRTHGRMQQNSVSWGAILWHFWHKFGLGNLIGPLALEAGTTQPTLHPESLRWHGITAWEAFHRVLDHLGWTLAPTMNSDRAAYVVRTGDSATTSRELAIIDLARKEALHDCEGQNESGPLPAKVRVYLPSRDYQWQRSARNAKTKTPQDRWDLNPLRFWDVPVRALPGVPEDTITRHTIVPNSVKTLYGTIPVIVDDRGEVWNRDLLDKHVQSIARTYIKSLQRYYRTGSFTYSGIWPIALGSSHTSAAYFDLGEGLFTRHLSRPLHLEPTVDVFKKPQALLDSTPESNAWQSPPDIRTHTPVPRQAYGFTYSDDQQQNTHDCYGPPITSKLQGILPGRRGWVAILYSTLSEDKEIQFWRGAGFVRAYNATDVAVPIRVRCQLEYNYQAGECGEWQITSVHRSRSDIQNACISSGTREIDKTKWRVKSPDLVTLYRQSSLRLAMRKNPQTAPQACEAVLDIAPGPNNTLFQSRNLNDPPRWSADASIRGSLTIGTWLKLKPDSEDHDDTWLGPPANRNIKLRLPPGGEPSLGGGSSDLLPGSYLVISAANKDCVSTEWFSPGITATMSFSYAFDGEGCSGNPTCVTLYFERGLLVDATGIQFTRQKPNTDIACGDIPELDYDPCNVGQQTYPGDYRPRSTSSPQEPTEPPTTDPITEPPTDIPDNPGGPSGDLCVIDGAGVLTCFNEDGQPYDPSTEIITLPENDIEFRPLRPTRQDNPLEPNDQPESNN